MNMSGFGCENISHMYVVPVFGFNALVSVIACLVCGYGSHKIMQTDLKRNIKIISTITLITSAINSSSDTLSIIAFFICPTTRRDNIVYVSVVMINLPVISLSLIMLQILFSTRLIDAFDTSSLRVSNTLKYTLYTLSFIEILLCLVSVIMYALFLFNDTRFFRKYSIDTVLSTLVFLTYLIHFMIIMKNFVKKFKEYAMLAADCHGKRNRIHRMINRLFVCWMCAFTSTIICLIVYSLLTFVFGTGKIGQVSKEIIYFPLLWTMVNIDSFFNLIALILQFSFSTKIYFKLCLKCDNQMNIWFKKHTSEANLRAWQTNNVPSNDDP